MAFRKLDIQNLKTQSVDFKDTLVIFGSTNTNINADVGFLGQLTSNRYAGLVRDGETEKFILVDNYGAISNNDINDTNVIAKGDLEVNTVSSVVSTLASFNNTTTNTFQTSIGTFDATKYGSCKFVIQVHDIITNNRHVTEILVTHDGTTAHYNEYGMIYTNAKLANFDVQMSANIVTLYANAVSSNSTKYNVSQTLIDL